MEIGAQFFTLRDFCKDTDSFAESLKKVADIGYKTVQISGTCEYDPKWLQQQLKENGLKCVLTHTPADKLQNDPAKVATDHDVFGCKYVGLGWFGFDEEKNIADFIRTYKSVFEALNQNGKYFMYHNHDHEFKKFNGKPVADKCPRCGGYMVIKGNKVVCADEQCGYVTEKKDENDE